MTIREHISYSEMKDWVFCPFYHKLNYIEGLKAFKGNEYTAFGTAIHSTCEESLLNKGNINHKNHFAETFVEEVKKLVEDSIDVKKKLILDMKQQGEALANLPYPAMKEYFDDFEVVSVEEQLYEPIDEFTEAEYKFKGFIDAVIKTSDGKYHIIDWKTCSWGWDMKKKTDPIINYQLTLYKHFFAKKHGIDPSNIETYFGLLKRTAKKDKVEIYKITSGSKKTENALKYILKALHNITNKKFIKNRLSCTSGYGCPFYKTENCP